MERSKNELITEKLENFKTFLKEHCSEQKFHKLDEYLKMDSKDMTTLILTNYTKNVDLRLIASRVIIELDMEINHLEKVEKYLRYFVTILDL